MRNLKEQEIKNIRNLTRYPEWVTYYTLLAEFMSSLNDISDVKIDNTDMIAAEVIGRRIMKDRFRDFLTAINIMSKDQKEVKDNTFE